MIEFILITALWCIGLTIITSHGFIFEKVKDILENFLPTFLFKPIIGCAICMASVHSIGMYFLMGMPFAWYLLPVAMVSVSGVVAIFFYFLPEEE